MIIDKVAPYWTEEDRHRLEEIRKEQQNVFTFISQSDDDNKNLSRLHGWYRLEEEANELKEAIENRYIKNRKEKNILEDVVEIVTAIEKEDFLNFLSKRADMLTTIRNNGASDDSLVEFTKENYNNCYWFILAQVRVQLNALTENEAGTDKAKSIVEKKVSLWYIKPHPEYMPMAHGKATDAFAFMSTKNANIDRITGTATIDKFGVQLVILRLKELQTTLGVSTDKLLSTAIATFTQQNDFRHTKTHEPKREVIIPLREYAQLCGYDVEEHETSTPEEAEREKKRAKAQLDNARKAIKKDLLLLQASTLRWEEPIKGKVRDFDSISLLTRVAIRNGEIRISFSPEIANYLVERNLITQYPVKLLKLDSRKPTAYYIGRKLAEHYNIDNNQIRGTHDRISIPKLLEVTDLPSYEEVQKKDRGHWVERIKEPLERALDTLTQEGILKDWKYTHAKGVDLTEEEAYTITSYEDFAKLYLLFTPADKVDHTDRIQAKQEAKAKAREKAKAKQREKKKATKKKG